MILHKASTNILNCRCLTVILTLLMFQSVHASNVVFHQPHINDDMQSQLNQAINELGLTDEVKRKQLGLVLLDITDESNPMLASVNGEKMFYAASLPKIVILLGAFHKAEKGLLTLTPALMDKMTQMIRYSSNAAATEMMNIVGKPYIAEMLQSEEYRFYDVEQGGGLWLGKEYAKAGAWKRDPLHNLSHGATGLQVAKFYYLLAREELLSPKSCSAMLEILSAPGIKHKFVKGLLTVDQNAKVFRKSGSWKHFHSDSALIERNGKRYIAVALVDGREGERWLQELIVKMDSIIFANDV